MRATLALLAAAAVVFAPGWGASDSLTGRTSSSELVGRILAPTFDDARAHPPPTEKGSSRRLDRITPRPVAPKALVSTWFVDLPSPTTQLWVALLAALVLAPSRCARAIHSPRAPPALPAV